MGNRRVLLLMTASILLMYGTPVQGQFVTLEGKDFKLDGEDFYVLAMNYSVLLARNDDVNGVPAPEDIYFAPDASFGPTSAFDCTGESDCQARLLTDFQKVREMGFNTVRVVAGFELDYRDTPEHGADERRFSLDISLNPFPNNSHDAGRIKVDLEPELDGPYADRFFQLIEDMLDVASQADLKVILLGVGASDKNDDENRRHMYPTFDQKAVDEYAAYLTHMAAALYNHPALLAYDLFNEPHFNTLEYQGAVDEEQPQSHPKWKKQDICDFTAQWYDAIKGQDPHHLITLGGLGDYELEVWDMAVLHIDFYSLHIYPLKDYKGDWDMEQSLEQFHALLHWFGQTCPMPWIIGETAFSASDATSPPHTGPASPPEVYQQYHQWPYMEGTEEDQRHFAEWSLALTRQCGGSGWSWWYFQEYLWWDHYYPIPEESTDPDPAYMQLDIHGNSIMRGIYYAMLHPGDGNADWYEKPAVDEVRNYVPAPMPDPPGDEPPNYYNIGNLPTISWLTGTVVDQHAHPVKDATARIWCKSDNENDPNPEHSLKTFHLAFVKTDGSFVFYKELTTPGYTVPVYENFVIAGVGISNIAYGTWSGTAIPNGATHPVNRHPFLFGSQLADVDIYSVEEEEAQHYHAWTDLAVQNATVHAGPDPGASHIEMAARHSVHVTGEFHAQAGSTLHVRTMETFSDCGAEAFKLLASPPATAALALKEAPASPNLLELRFLPVETDNVVRVFPNPFQDVVKMEYSNADASGWIEVLDGLGRVVHRQQMEGPRTVLSLRHLAPGPYQVILRQGQQLWSQTLIKQP